MKLIIINGPNLNLLGIREKNIYGDIRFEDFLSKVKSKYSHIQIDYFQSNIEGEIINKLHEAGFEYDGILLNAGGYTHTSIAIGDAVNAITTPVIEIHISNIFKREDFRHMSHIAPYAAGSIIGFGLDSYLLGIEKYLMD